MRMSGRAEGVERDARWFGSRAALLVGFGALLILMAVLCSDALYTLGAFEADNGKIRQDFLYRARTLEQVRAGLYESGNIIRDFVLTESDPRDRKAVWAELQSIHNKDSAALKTCIGTLSSGDREPFKHLSVELENYRAMIGSIFAADMRKEADKQRLQREVFRQHAEMLAITREVSELNDDELKESGVRITDAFMKFRGRLLTVAMIAFMLGACLAATTVIYVGSLESSVARKYRESLGAQRELKELSKRLVDAGETERRAISRELHDEVGQSLSALLMDVENLTELSNVAGPNGAFREGLQNIKKLAENSVNDVRNMALLLRPSMLDDLGLMAAIDWQGREVSKRTGMIVEMGEENVSENLPDEHKICIYRIVQEALNNCSKHADAKNVRIVVRQEKNRLRVTIEDDGKGFDASRVRGMGLAGMNERVSHLGGKMKVESDGKHGTRLTVDLPLPNEFASAEN